MKSLVAIMLSAGLLVSAGCAGKAEPLRIAISEFPGYEFLYLAQQKGFFDAEGVAVRLVEFGSLADARRAYERGQVDGMASTLVEVLQARTSPHAWPVITQVLDYSNGADVILAPRALSTVADLTGRRIGVEVDALGTYVVARALELNGVDPGRVTLVAASPLSMPELLAEGRIDAAVTYPPHSLRMLDGGALHDLFDSSQIPGEILDVLAFDSEIVGQRSRAVRAVVRAHARALEYARQHRDEAYAVMAARERIAPNEFSRVLSEEIRMVQPREQAAYLGRNGRVAALLPKITAVLTRYGHVQNSPDLSAYYSAAFLDVVPQP